MKSRNVNFQRKTCKMIMHSPCPDAKLDMYKASAVEGLLFEADSLFFSAHFHFLWHPS